MEGVIRVAESLAELVDALRTHQGVTVDAAAEVVSVAGLPRDLMELLAITRGIRLDALGYIDFTGGGKAVPLEEAFPRGLTLAEIDGDAWVLDHGEHGDASSVYFLSHDPPVVVHQFRTLRAFLAALASRDIVGEAYTLARRAWHDAPGGTAAGDAAQSDDPVIAAFAQGLPGEYRVHDLRGEAASSFAWGHGRKPHGIVRDDGYPLFATEPPRARRGFGVVARLFGGAGS
jgi:hypothetical protein